MIKTFFKYISLFISCIVAIIFVCIILYLVYKAIDYFDINLILEELLAPLYGTIILVLLSVIFATILGIPTAIYIEMYATKRIKSILDFSFELLASMPSIIIGLFGFSLLLLLHQIEHNFKSSLLLSSSMVAMLILPYIVKSTQLGIQECQKDFINIGYSLGASKDKIILNILLPFAKRHIVKGIFLAIARSAEDTATIMLTGVVASYGYVDSLFSPFEALPFYIYQTTTNYSNPAQLGGIFVASIALMMISVLFMGLISRGKYVKI